jgi:hypothetical protein
MESNFYKDVCSALMSLVKDMHSRTQLNDKSLFFIIIVMSITLFVNSSDKISVSFDYKNKLAITKGLCNVHV